MIQHWRKAQAANESKAPKRNGASLAADPTLTGVWAPEGALDAWRLDATWMLLRASYGGVSIARRSRRCRFRPGAGFDPKISPAARRFRDRSFGLGLERPRIARRLCGSSAPDRKARPVRLCALAGSAV